jgi:hypothetical protein
MLKRFSALVIAGAALAACSESTPPTGVVPLPGGANQSVLAELTCRVDASAGTMSCAPAGPSAVAGRSADLIFGGQNQYVKLTSTNVMTTATVSVTADVSVKNLTGQPWGVDSLGTLDTAAVKVFVVQAPTSPVVIANPTGTAFFTASNQQYFKYSGALLGGDNILSAGETSGAINWQFTLNGATTFTFGVLIVTDMPDEQGTLRWVRDTTAITAPGAYLTSVWGSSATDVWAGGGAGGTALMRWNGSTWTPYSYAANVGGLWGTSSTNIYAATSTGIAKWNGTSWAAESYVASNSMYAVWGSSATDIYVGGAAGSLAHYDGVSWTNVASSGIVAGELVTSIWGTSASNVYVATASGTAGLGLHRFDGTSWSTVTAGINAARVVWGSSASDVYVGGDFGLLRHWNGTSWSTVSGFGTTSTDGIQGIWGASANDIYVAQASGTIWHYNGYTWTSLANSGARLFAVWGSGNDVFVAGYPSAPTYYGIVIRGMR